MPVRRNIARDLTEKFTGVQVWDGRVGECVTMPTTAYEQATDAADLLFEFVVTRIDWARVLIEATSRHLSLLNADAHPTFRSSGFDMDDEKPCGECVEAALLMTDRDPTGSGWVSDGKPTPTPYRIRQLAGTAAGVPDYAAGLAEAVRHRRAITD